MFFNKGFLGRKSGWTLPVLTSLCLSVACIASGGFKTVVIDAGHGGADLGASDSLVYEKHINLDVARRLEIILQKMGYKTVMTRPSDAFVPLDQRATIANRYRNSIFLSIHFNSSWKNKVSGVETYYRSASGKKLASVVQRQLIRNLGAQDRGVKSGNFVVIKKTRHPAILIEGGFVSNKIERAAMQDPRFRQLVAESVAKAVNSAQRLRL